MFLFINSTSITLANKQFDVSSFIQEIEEYTNEAFPEFSDKTWLDNILERQYAN